MSIAVKEILALVALVDHIFWRHPYANDKEFQKFVLINGREDWPSGDELDQDATKGPHIDCLIIW